MKDKKEDIKQEIITLTNEGRDLGVSLLKKKEDKEEKAKFIVGYQSWYTKSLRVVEFLAPDRYQEFRSYYQGDPKRKDVTAVNYVIQDYVRGLTLSWPKEFDSTSATIKNHSNQVGILRSLVHRIDTSLGNIENELFAELQDTELKSASKLLKVSHRAAGALAGVVLETHLQKIIRAHEIPMRKKDPTIGDLNEPLKKHKVIDTL